jgi:hypothetical protein
MRPGRSSTWSDNYSQDPAHRGCSPSSLLAATEAYAPRLDERAALLAGTGRSGGEHQQLGCWDAAAAAPRQRRPTLRGTQSRSCWPAAGPALVKPTRSKWSADR